jgi:hypothetical protein
MSDDATSLETGRRLPAPGESLGYLLSRELTAIDIGRSQHVQYP